MLFAIAESGVTSEEKDKILEIHNFLRSCTASGPDSDSCKNLGVTQQQPKGQNILAMVNKLMLSNAFLN